jgi:VanZ family protein
MHSAYVTPARWPSALPLISWCILIFVLSSLPGTSYPQVTWPFADKLVHLSLYAGLGVCAALYFTCRNYSAPVPVLFGMLYGISDELHQVFIPARSCSVADWAADCLGVFLGVLLFRRLYYSLQNCRLTPDVSNPNTSESMELT